MRKNKRQKIIEELDLISEELLVDYHNPSHFNSEDEYLLVKQKIIRGAIINAHAYLDHLLTLHINKIVFNKRAKNLKKIMDRNDVIKNTNLYLIREIDFEKKRKWLNKIISGWMRKDIYKRLEDINGIRNIIAHSYNFDIRKDDYWNKTLPYKGNDIMSYDGISTFMADIGDVSTYLENL